MVTQGRIGRAGVVLAVLFAALSSPAALGAADGEVIAYTRHGDIFVMYDDGTGAARLTRGAAWDAEPTWSPDGRRIAFIRCCSAVWRRDASVLMVMNADGSNLREVSRDLRGKVHEVSWSPDGKLLLYSDVVQRPDWTYRGSLRVADPDTGAWTALTGYRSSNVGGRWSPDGRSVLFMSDRTGDVEFYLAAPDGSWRRRLTALPGTDFGPTWSPDGARIAFVHESEDFGWSWHLHVLDVATGTVQQLTEGNVMDFNPTWHPSGTSLLIERWAMEEGATGGVFTVAVSGGAPTLMIADAAQPSWSPDGDTVLFTLTDDLWTAAADGSEQRRLTATTLYEGTAAWRPAVVPGGPADEGVAQ